MFQKFRNGRRFPTLPNSEPIPSMSTTNNEYEFPIVPMLKLETEVQPVLLSALPHLDQLNSWVSFRMRSYSPWL